MLILPNQTIIKFKPTDYEMNVIKGMGKRVSTDDDMEEEDKYKLGGDARTPQH